jgi:hypothetical protein
MLNKEKRRNIMKYKVTKNKMSPFSSLKMIVIKLKIFSNVLSSDTVEAK